MYLKKITIILLCGCVLLLQMCHLGAIHYQGYNFKVELPNDGELFYKFKGICSLNLFENDYFLAIEVVEHRLGESFIQSMINQPEEGVLQDGFFYWLKSTYLQGFNQPQIIQTHSIPFNDYPFLYILWTGEAKQNLFQQKTLGKTLYFSQYFLPNPYDWQSVFVINGYSNTMNEEVHKKILDVAMTFKAEKAPPRDWRYP